MWGQVREAFSWGVGKLWEFFTDHNGKLSASRLLLMYWTYKYVQWVEAGTVEFEGWVLIALLSGPGIALALKTAPGKALGDLANMFRGK